MNKQPPTFIQSKLDIHLWWMTASLITMNVGLFIWEVLHGLDINSPTTADAIRWGADFAPLTFLMEPQRLFTSMFFHFGLAHLMLNMWALYVFGKIAEQLYGRLYFLGLYFLAGVMGSLLSGYIAIQDSYSLLQSSSIEQNLLPSVSAGASGAVMGLGASLTVFALLPALPSARFSLDRKTLIIVMLLNLAIGFTINGINNAAHMGGLIMGIILTLIWYVGQKLSYPRLFALLGLLIGIIICIIFYQYCLRLIENLLPFWQQLLQWILKN
ncbi:MULTISPECIES: rhomboid family intramembrane serine protease [unclassified Acinetobacter]|uniref:rhomboid family intramembrane serine protease n=1 Tax=unclassified Acinetobacter TaxID=196816 RepID=UPI0029345B97|nr:MULTISPECIES: rhomboid family intramembrane serine protease [unclassified Acinetobacter]WOE31451.1 rhomboid family intramembrane serine protease [Acinetobacter sp. SAAs470]WOE39647.1 rhomboid family intramembrane serine protease [Acinetobacter sp. SAAs474]